MMPKIAEGSANKVGAIPSKMTKAMEGLAVSIIPIVGIREDAMPDPRSTEGPRSRSPASPVTPS